MTAPHGDRPDSAPSARPLLLIVDDEPLSVRLIVMALKDQYALVTATNGRDALRLMKEQRPDLVLLDVVLPDVDGIEVFRQAQADATLAAIPVVFVTAVAASAGQTAALQLSAADYLVKPINLVHLRLRVRNQLEIKRQQGEIRAMNRVLEIRNAELEELLNRVRHLESIVSICRYCTKIRVEHDGWQRIEQYVSDHADVIFSYGTCPDCRSRAVASSPAFEPNERAP